MTRRVVVPLLAMAGVLVAPAASAAGAEALAAARAAFERATRLESSGRWAEAIVELDAAIAVKETPGLRYHRGHCLEQLGRPAEALADFERAKALLEAGARAPDVERLLGDSLQRVAARVARLTVIVRGPGTAAVRLEGGREVSAGQALVLDPGPVSIHVEAAGWTGRTLRLELAPGRDESIEVALERTPEAAEAPAERPARVAQAPRAPRLPPRAASAPSGASRTLVLFTEGAFTAMGVGVGVGFTLASSAASDRVEEARRRLDREAPGDVSACREPAAEQASSCTALRAAVDDRDRARTLGAVGFVAGGVGAVALVTTLVLWRPPEREGVAVRVVPSRRGVYGGLVGRF